MVLDDLVVKPMSTISSITLLNQFSIKDVGVLKEKVVTLGMDEVYKLCVPTTILLHFLLQISETTSYIICLLFRL